MSVSEAPSFLIRRRTPAPGVAELEPALAREVVRAHRLEEQVAKLTAERDCFKDEADYARSKRDEESGRFLGQIAELQSKLDFLNAMDAARREGKRHRDRARRKSKS